MPHRVPHSPSYKLGVQLQYWQTLRSVDHVLFKQVFHMRQKHVVSACFVSITTLILICGLVIFL